jgi:hypothetical protein
MTMKAVLLGLLACLATASCVAQRTAKEKGVVAYYSGFEHHEWSEVASQLAEGFTFTSPNNDDHISVEEFKEKCFSTNKFFKKVSYIRFAESGEDVFLLVEIVTTDGTIVRNVDVYHFDSGRDSGRDGGKIKSIETFFGPGDWFPGNKKK